MVIIIVSSVITLCAIVLNASVLNDTMPSVFVLIVFKLVLLAEGHYDQCCLVKCCNAEFNYAECDYVKMCALYRVPIH